MVTPGNGRAGAEKQFSLEANQHQLCMSAIGNLRIHHCFFLLETDTSTANRLKPRDKSLIESAWQEFGGTEGYAKGRLGTALSLPTLGFMRVQDSLLNAAHRQLRAVVHASYNA
jgi:hypothetical protein